MNYFPSFDFMLKCEMEMFLSGYVRLICVLAMRVIEAGWFILAVKFPVPH